MPSVGPYNTDSPEYPPEHRLVYHDKDTCRIGKLIEAHHKKTGTGGKKHCMDCFKVL